MRLFHSLAIAALLAFSFPTFSVAADEGEKVEVSAIPAAVKDGFTKEVPGGTITSVKKLGGDKVRYRIMYKLDGKEHQITLDEAGARTAHPKKKDGDAK